MKSKALSSKCCSLLLVLVLLLTPVAPLVATDETPVSLVPALMTGNTVSLAMQINSTWEGYFNGTITLTNTGEKKIENWALSFAFPHNITNIWDGIIFEKADGLYTVKNAWWNQDIPVGGSVSFGFTAQQNGEALTPEFYFINIAQRTVPSTDYEATYKLKKDWGTGFSGEITLKNISSQTIEDWSFSMDFTRTIASASNTVFTQGEGTQYLLANPGYDQNINTGKSIKFSIQGTGGVETDVPSNFLVSQVTIGVSLTGDYDADGVKDYEELVIYGTDPLIDDSNTEPDPDLVTDTDGDGIPDYYELELGTDPLLVDTDDDGIDDMTEIICGLDPLISDLDEDFDGDGFTLQQEQELGTEFWNEDTDYDGLLDAEEVNSYGTDPLLEDTDGDGLLDGDEIALGLDPLSPASFGVPDNEYMQTHVFSSDSDVFSEINIEDAPYTMSAEITASGNVPEYLTVSESSYAVTVQNDAMLGLVAELEYEGSYVIEEVKLKFQIKDEFIPNTGSEYASANPEFEGIKRYNVFRYFEDINMLLPVETYFDIENQIAYAVTDLIGTYCLIDMEKWLDSIGILPMDIAVDTESSATPINFEVVGGPDASLLSLKRESALRSQISSGALFSGNQVRSDRYNGHRYAVIDKGDMPWPDAKAYCEYMGGHLVTITSTEEQEFIDEMLTYGQMNLYWIGAYRDGTEFRWITGETFDYSNWDVGEPNYDIENCVHMYRNSWLASELGTWNDTYEYLGGTAFHSTINAGLVCEWETPVFLLYGMSLSPCYRAAELSNIADTDWDEDGTPNWQEIRIDPNLGYWNFDGTYVPATLRDYMGMKSGILGLGNPFTRYFLDPVIIPVLPTKSNPEKEDGDGDGLLEGKDLLTSDGKKVGPADPDTNKANGPTGIWQAQLEMEQSGNIPQTLVNYDEIVFEESGFAKWPSATIGGGAMALHFRYDTMKMALHSRPETWQRAYGYSDLIDDLFYVGTGGNMRKAKFEFAYNNEKYVIWTWRGYYYQLESGAEIGMYTNPHEIKVGDVVLIEEQWDAINFEIPMTINLYNVYGKNDVQNVFSWAPKEEQWWITGFNPEFTSPKAEKMAVLGTLDFTGREGMFIELQQTYSDDSDFLIFDKDGHTVWFIWWGN